MLSVTLYRLILAPGVIQLTVLDGRSIERQIMQLARDPRYSTVLTVRSGVTMRSTGASDGAQLINRDPTQPAAQVSLQSGQPATPQASGDGATGGPVLPIIPVFPGSTDVDYTCSVLGLLSRGHYRMLDTIIAPLGRQLWPVSYCFH